MLMSPTVAISELLDGVQKNCKMTVTEYVTMGKGFLFLATLT